MTGDLCDNNNKKYKMINECDPVINKENVKHLSHIGHLKIVIKILCIYIQIL